MREAVDNASRLLEDTIGYQIREVPGKRLYIVVNSLDLAGLEEHLSQDEQCEHVRGLICIILSLILMNIGETLAETDLWNFLREINIDHDDKYGCCLHCDARIHYLLFPWIQFVLRTSTIDSFDRTCVNRGSSRKWRT